MPMEERELHNNGLSEDTSTVLRDGGIDAVSYTHLDVYKRQVLTEVPVMLTLVKSANKLNEKFKYE